MGKLVFTNQSEEEIRSMLRHQDERVIPLLYSQYSHILFNVILRIVKYEDLAQDVFQEALMKIWKKGHMYDAKKGSLFTWMVSISRNSAIDATRSKAYKLRERQIQNETELGEEPLSIAESHEVTQLQEVIKLLPPHQKLLIDLSYFQGYTHEEISKKLDIPLGTVKTRIRSAIKKLRKLLYT